MFSIKFLVHPPGRRLKSKLLPGHCIEIYVNSNTDTSVIDSWQQGCCLSVVGVTGLLHSVFPPLSSLFPLFVFSVLVDILLLSLSYMYFLPACTS